ncbi:MAG: rod shape-determining protein MreD [Chloroflexi bacterium]|nr:rod shape-determining protein MreD [Chloroflexota bacterium]
MVLLQAEFLPALLPSLDQFIPDMTLLVVVTWALTLRWQWAIPLGFATGLVLDLINPATYPTGTNTLLYTIVALGVGLLRQPPFSMSVVRAIPITLCAAFSYRILLLLGQEILGYNNLQFKIILQVILPVAIIDAALMLVVFVVVRALSQIGAPRE